jgi:hypothetical protein
MLKLATSAVTPMTEERLTRMLVDAKMLQRLDIAELRCAYSTIEALRDALSHMLDRMDGK